MCVRVHAVIAATRLEVSHKAETKRPAAVLIALELGDSSISGLGVVKTNNTCATRPPAWLVLDFSLLDLSDGSEQIDQILIARGPRKLLSN